MTVLSSRLAQRHLSSCSSEQSRYGKSLYRILGIINGEIILRKLSILSLEILNLKYFLSLFIDVIIPSLASIDFDNNSFFFLVNDWVFIQAWLPSFVPSSINHTANIKGVMSFLIDFGTIFLSPT